MTVLKQACVDIANNPHVMTFSDIATAASKGAILGAKVNNALTGAVLGVTLEASKRALLMSEEMLRYLDQEKTVKEIKKSRLHMRAD